MTFSKNVYSCFLNCKNITCSQEIFYFQIFDKNLKEVNEWIKSAYKKLLIHAIYRPKIIFQIFDQ